MADVVAQVLPASDATPALTPARRSLLPAWLLASQDNLAKLTATHDVARQSIANLRTSIKKFDDMVEERTAPKPEAAREVLRAQLAAYKTYLPWKKENDALETVAEVAAQIVESQLESAELSEFKAAKAMVRSGMPSLALCPLSPCRAASSLRLSSCIIACSYITWPP